MKQAFGEFFVFLDLGVLSGLVSCVLTLLTSGVFLPGLVFGIAVSHAIQISWTALTLRHRIVLVATSTIGSLLAIIVILLFSRVGNGYAAALIASAWGSFIGFMPMALVLMWISPPLQHPYTLPILGASALILGAVATPLAAYISDHHIWGGHPIDDFVVFPLWQGGMAGMIALCGQRRSSG